MKNMRWLIVSQTIAVVAAGVILPFYIVFLQQTADSYSLFAYLYASFALAGALTHFCIGSLAKRISPRDMLIIGNLLAGIILLLVPQLDTLLQLYIAQVILGISMSLQKSGEKIAVAAITTAKTRAAQIGNYHAIVSIATAVMLFGTGWLLDTFSLVFIFYIAGVWLIIAGILSVKVTT